MMNNDKYTPAESDLCHLPSNSWPDITRPQRSRESRALGQISRAGEVRVGQTRSAGVKLSHRDWWRVATARPRSCRWRVFIDDNLICLLCKRLRSSLVMAAILATRPSVT